MFDRPTLAALVLLASTSAAHADVWMVTEAPAAVAVSDAQRGIFRPGVMPAIGAYADNGWFALGARLRIGLLRNGPSPGGNFEDPSTAGLGTATLAMRVHRGGVWSELAGGGGITGSDVVPTVEVGAGWNFEVGDLTVGPGIRYVRVIASDPMLTLGSASLVLAGVDIQWGLDRPRVRGRATPVELAATPAAAQPPPVFVAESDHDQIVDRDASCAEDVDGCAVSEHLTMKNDRIVLDERVLFDTGKARIRASGREMLAEIATAWRGHPDWLRMTIEGHTDVRGSDEYNQRLSEQRAERTREELVRQGFAADRIDVIGHGRSRPRDPGTDAASLQRNRRVEFVIDRGVTQ
ncbi:MAG: OmpA family protein [Polyangiales bacterium]